MYNINYFKFYSKIKEVIHSFLNQYQIIMNVFCHIYQRYQSFRNCKQHHKQTKAKCYFCLHLNCCQYFHLHWWQCSCFLFPLPCGVIIDKKSIIYFLVSAGWYCWCTSPMTQCATTIWSSIRTCCLMNNIIHAPNIISWEKHFNRIFQLPNSYHLS